MCIPELSNTFQGDTIQAQMLFLISVQVSLQPNHHFMVKRFCDTMVADNMVYTHEDVVLIQYDFFLTNVRPTV